ncbi:MAG: prolipoprotein diacylglyceryl transferase [Patescibacteria group bacterium]
MLPYFHLTIIHLGPLTIQIWGLIVALGMFLSLIILWYRGKKLGADVEQLLDLTIWVIISGLIFSRVFHVVFYEPAYYFSAPLEMLKIWKGGMSSFGGIAGGALGFFWYVWRKKIAKQAIIPILDQICLAAIFGWIVGRFGCVFTHLHPGRLSDSFLAVKFPASAEAAAGKLDGARLDMAVIEILFLIPLAIFFFVMRNKKMFSGFFLSTLLIYYGILRFILDFFRATDLMGADARYLGLTPAQYFAILIAVVGVILSFRPRHSGGGIFQS